MTSILIRITPVQWTDAAIKMEAAAGWQANYTGSAMMQFIAEGSLSVGIDLQGSAMIGFTAKGEITTREQAALASVWGLNTYTGGHFTYDSFPFTSFFRLGNKHYGCNADGVFELTGELQDDAPINWIAKSPTTDFSTDRKPVGRNVKYVRDSYAVLRTLGDVFIRAITNEETSRPNLLAAADGKNGMHTRRVPIPKGMKGNVWQFELSGANATTLGSFEVEPLVSKRSS